MVSTPGFDPSLFPLSGFRYADMKGSTEGTTATEALEKGFDDLIDLCDVVEDKFAAARHEFTGSRETST